MQPVTFYGKDGKEEFSGKASDEVLINEKGKIKKGGKAKDISDSDVHLNGYLVIMEHQLSYIDSKT